MKTKLFFSLLVALMWGSQIFGQKEINFGALKTDLFQKVHKGAMWSQRPEAKIVYEGGAPSEVVVHVLEHNSLIRFVDNEHNPFDGNYIIVPKGERIYEKAGERFLAICGNKIESLRYIVDDNISGVNSVNDTDINIHVSGEITLKTEKPVNPNGSITQNQNQTRGSSNYHNYNDDYRDVLVYIGGRPVHQMKAYKIFWRGVWRYVSFDDYDNYRGQKKCVIHRIWPNEQPIIVTRVSFPRPVFIPTQFAGRPVYCHRIGYRR